MIQFGLIIWIMLAGLAYMVRGPRSAGAVMRWPVVATFRLMRRTIGGFFVWLGNMIRGQQGQRRNRNRDDDRH